MSLAEPDRWERALDAAVATIRAKYPDDDRMTYEQFASMTDEISAAHRKHMPRTKQEWLEHYGDFPCLSCEHYAGIHDDGRVTCRGVTVTIPHGMQSVTRETWMLRMPCCWTEYAGSKEANCYEYKRIRRGKQTRMVGV